MKAARRIRAAACCWPALAVWEALPRLGLVDPDLLPPFSDRGATIPALLGRASIQSDLR